MTTPRKYSANDVQIAVAGGFISVNGLAKTPLVENGYMGNLARDLLDKNGKVLAHEGDHVIADGKGGYEIESTISFESALQLEREKISVEIQHTLDNPRSIKDMLPKK